MRLRHALAGLAIAGTAALAMVVWPREAVFFEGEPLVEVDDADAFVVRKQAESAAAGAWEVARERLVRNVPGRAAEAILYIHGFGASRGEGEAVIDQIARERRANVYYLRLPGHGTSLEDHAATTAADYLSEVSEALGMMSALGERTVVAGTSTGGLLATWLAGTYPEAVDALVVASPLYGFADPMATPLLGMRGGPALAKLVFGEVRDTHWEHPDKREGYDERWLLEQSYDALVPLEEIRKVGSDPEVVAAVRAPALGLVHYASESDHDDVISIPAVREVFGSLGGASPHAQTRLVQIADAHHVLMSEYVRTDKDAVLAELRGFLRDVLGEPASPPEQPAAEVESPPGEAPEAPEDSPQAPSAN